MPLCFERQYQTQQTVSETRVCVTPCLCGPQNQQAPYHHGAPGPHILGTCSRYSEWDVPLSMRTAARSLYVVSQLHCFVLFELLTQLLQRRKSGCMKHFNAYWKHGWDWHEIVCISAVRTSTDFHSRGAFMHDLYIPFQARLPTLQSIKASQWIMILNLAYGAMVIISIILQFFRAVGVRLYLPISCFVLPPPNFFQ